MTRVGKIGRLQDALARKYLGKRGIHAISVDEKNSVVNVYLEPNQEPNETVENLRRDAGTFDVRTFQSARARLAVSQR